MTRFILLVATLVTGGIWWYTSDVKPWGIICCVCGALLLLAMLIKSDPQAIHGNSWDWTDFGDSGGD